MSKSKFKGETREQRFQRLQAEKKVNDDNKANELAWGIRLRMSQKKNDYIKNLINGRYYLARCNMIAEQLIGKRIEEKIDGCPKSEEYMRAEYALMKMQAIVSMRNAHFAKQDLFKEFNLKPEDIEALEMDYYDGKIIREDYDDEYKRKNKAEFVSDAPGN